jgi:hypothetical protein
VSLVEHTGRNSVPSRSSTLGGMILLSRFAAGVVPGGVVGVEAASLACCARKTLGHGEGRQTSPLEGKPSKCFSRRRCFGRPDQDLVLVTSSANLLQTRCGMWMSLSMCRLISTSKSLCHGCRRFFFIAGIGVVVEVQASCAVPWLTHFSQY